MTRMEVARYVAQNLSQGRTQALNEAAAWLISGGQVRQARYLASDVARIVAKSGYLYIVVTTAQPLSSDTKAKIESYLKTVTGAITIEMSEIINPSIIGGVRIETPTAVLDGTVYTKLANLVEGMSR